MRLLPAACVALVLALTGCGDTAGKTRVQQATARSAASVEKVSVEGGDGRVLVPRNPTGRLVLYVHGSGGGATTVLTDVHLSRLLVELLGRGYMIAGGEGAGAQWGSDASVASYAALVDRAKDFGPVNRVYLLGQSIGGMSSLRLIDALPKVAAWAGIYPVCNLNTVYPRFRKDLEATFGNGLAAARITGSPIVPVKLKGFPMVMWASAADTIVPAATNALLCADRFRAAGADVTVIATVGRHGDASNFQPQVLANFFDAA